MTVARALHIGEYLHDLREHYGRSLNDIAAAGGPYRQAQSAIESASAQPHELDRHLPDYDRAYSWPAGMAQALRRHIETLQSGQDPTQDWKPHPAPSYALFYNAQRDLILDRPGGEHSWSPRLAIIGFNAEPGPEFGTPIDLEPKATVLTNAHPLALTRVAHSRTWITTIDARIDHLTLPDGETHILRQFHNDVTTRHPEGSNSRDVQIGLGRHASDYGQPITINPTARLTHIDSARVLAAALISARPEFGDHSVDRIAYTLLGIAAYGDGLHTLSALGHHRTRALLKAQTESVRVDSDPAAPVPAADFLGYWDRALYKPSQAGPDLAQPDPAASSLLGGLLRAAARDTGWSISGERRPASGLDYSGPQLDDPETWDPWTHTAVTYDADLAPEIPAIIANGIPTGMLNFYAATNLAAGTHVLAQRIGSSIGIDTTASDDAILGARSATVATLTHYVGSTAIYTPPRGLPQRIYLPTW